MLSVIIPVGPSRNARAAADSLQSAGLENGDEVIFIGDGHLPEVPLPDSVAPFASITLIQPKAGANAARNHGIRLARNPILCFLDDDDAYLPGALHIIRAHAQSQPEQHAWSADWRCLRKQSHPRIKRPNLLSENSLHKRNIAGGCSSMIVRKAVFDTTGLFDETLPSMQDWDMWLRLAKQAPIKRIKQPLICYNNELTNRISTQLKIRLKGLQLLLEKHAVNWTADEIAFHSSRIAGLAYTLGKGSFKAIPHFKAPLASSYFCLRALYQRYFCK